MDRVDGEDRVDGPARADDTVQDHMSRVVIRISNPFTIIQTSTSI